MNIETATKQSTHASKEKILAEIRRLHKATGTVPGRLKLESESGIRETDWRGVYWARSARDLDPGSILTTMPACTTA